MKDYKAKAKEMAKLSVDLFKAGMHVCKTKEALISEMERVTKLFSEGSEKREYYSLQTMYIKKFLKEQNSNKDETNNILSES